MPLTGGSCDNSEEEVLTRGPQRAVRQGLTGGP
jgi:hypothetical protein